MSVLVLYTSKNTYLNICKAFSKHEKEMSNYQNADAAFIFINGQQIASHRYHIM